MVGVKFSLMSGYHIYPNMSYGILTNWVTRLVTLVKQGFLVICWFCWCIVVGQGGQECNWFTLHTVTNPGYFGFRGEMQIHPSTPPNNDYSFIYMYWLCVKNALQHVFFYMWWASNNFKFKFDFANTFIADLGPKSHWVTWEKWVTNLNTGNHTVPANALIISFKCRSRC